MNEETEITTTTLTPEIVQEMLQARHYKDYREVAEEMQPADLAELLGALEGEPRMLAFRLLKKDVAAEAFSYMDSAVRSEIIDAFSDAELISALEAMSLDDAADMLEEMPANVVKRVLERSSKSTRENLNRLLTYPENSAGSIMTPEYVRLRANMTVGDAHKEIRRVGAEAETIYTLYVVDKNKLLGVVSARDLLLNDPGKPLSDVMDTNVISVQVTDDREFVAREINRYDFMAMPVVDSEGMLVGIVTMDDAMDVLIEESTEDIEKMNAMTPSEETYFNTSVLDHAKHRIPWLLFLMISSTISGMLLTHYSDIFAAMPILVSFIPTLMDTGGNSGSQASTLIIRGLALGEVKTHDVFRVMFKELRVGLICSIVLAIVNGLRVFIMYKNLGVAVLVSGTMILTMIFAKLLGGTLPILAKKLGFDPALMASPLITTIVDAFSILIYFNIAGRVYGML